MQMRSKTYLQLVTLWRSFREWVSPHAQNAPAETSPSLIYIAVALALLLAILEVDAHRRQLESLGLLTDSDRIDERFLSP